MCSVWEKPKVKEVSVGEIRTAFRQSFFEHMEELILSGGEPTLRADLCEITEALMACFPKLRFIALLTNGFSTARALERIKRILELVKASKKDISFFVQISLDGIMQTHDHIRGVKGAFTRGTDTIQQLKELAAVNKNLFLGLHCVIQKRNVGELEQIDTISGRLGVPIFYSPPVISSNYFSNINRADSLALTQDELDCVKLFLVEKAGTAYFDDKLYYQDSVAMLNGATRQRKCMFGLLRIYIDANLDVYHCLNDNTLPLVNLQSDSIGRLWDSAKAKKWRSKIRTTKCPTCVSGCYTDLVGWREVAKNPGFKIKNLTSTNRKEEQSL